MKPLPLQRVTVVAIGQAVAGPKLAARDCWREVDSPSGAIRALVPPVRMRQVEPVMGAVPGLGQHSQAILEELAFDRPTIARWAATGVI